MQTLAAPRKHPDLPASFAVLTKSHAGLLRAHKIAPASTPVAPSTPDWRVFGEQEEEARE